MKQYSPNLNIIITTYPYIYLYIQQGSGPLHYTCNIGTTHMPYLCKRQSLVHCQSIYGCTMLLPLNDYPHNSLVFERHSVSWTSLFFPVILDSPSLLWCKLDMRPHKPSVYCMVLLSSLGNSLISSQSQKQTIVARSNTKAKIALLQTPQPSFCGYIGYYRILEITAPLHLLWVSICIHIAHNDVFREHTKLIEIDCHFFGHHLLQGTLKL